MLTTLRVNSFQFNRNKSDWMWFNRRWYGKAAPPPKKSNTKHKYQLKYRRKWYHTLNWIAEECGFSMQKHENRKSHYLHQLHRDVILLTVLSCATNSFAHSLLCWIVLHAACCCLFVFQRPSFTVWNFNSFCLLTFIFSRFIFLRFQDLAYLIAG